jgi:hypothetical protein
MKSFVEFKLNEIGDRINTPHIIKKTSHPFPLEGGNGKSFLYDLEIEDETYRIFIQIISNNKGDSALKIDFTRIVGAHLGEIYDYEIINKNLMLKVMSNLLGVLRDWLFDYQGNEKIFSIIMGAKVENDDDIRRSNIYDAIMKKNLDRFGVKIKEVVDMTSIWKKGFPNSGDLKILKYRIQPTTLDQMRKSIQN